MLLCKVCGRAAEAIVDELAMCAENGRYPERLSILIDGLIDLTDFEWEQDQLERGNEISEDHISGGSLVYKLLSSTCVPKKYKNAAKMAKYVDLTVHMCSVNARFKQTFISCMEDSECGIQAFRFELGDVVGDICAAVMLIIK